MIQTYTKNVLNVQTYKRTNVQTYDFSSCLSLEGDRPRVFYRVREFRNINVIVKFSAANIAIFS